MACVQRGGGIAADPRAAGPDPSRPEWPPLLQVQPGQHPCLCPSRGPSGPCPKEGPWSPAHTAPLTDHLWGCCSPLPLQTPGKAKIRPQVPGGVAPEKTLRAAVPFPSRRHRDRACQHTGLGPAAPPRACAQVAALKPAPRRNARSGREASKDGKRGPRCSAPLSRRGPPTSTHGGRGKRAGSAHTAGRHLATRADRDARYVARLGRCAGDSGQTQTSHLVGLRSHAQDP